MVIPLLVALVNTIEKRMVADNGCEFMFVSGY